MRRPRDHDQRLTEVTRRRIEALAATRPAADHPTPGPEPRPTLEPGPGRHARRPVRLGGRVTAWVADRLPATLQGRVHLGAAQLGLVALVVAVGLVLTSWWMVRARGGEETVAPPRPVAESATASGATAPGAAAATSTGGPAATDAASVVVDVAGRVRRPGIAVLPAGSRVVDALEAAGGVRRGVDLTAVNLARVLVDGEQVLVGARSATSGAGPAGPAGSAAPAAPATSALVSINTADQPTLEGLPGVGPVTAAAIISWREEHGAFAAVEELLEVSGIGPATLAELLPHVTL